MDKAYRSCVAMYSALAAGLAYGAVANHHAPVSGFYFPIVAGISVAFLVVASFRRGAVGPGLCGGLAGFGSLLITLDAFGGVNRDTLLPQVLMALPFLLAVGYAVRSGAWLAAIGAAGFFATAVALLYCNSGGGWVGFFYVYSV